MGVRVWVVEGRKPVDHFVVVFGDKGPELVGRDVHGVVFQRVRGWADDHALGFDEGIDEGCKGHGDRGEVELWQVADVGRAFPHGAGLADAGVADEEDIHVGVKRPGGSHPDLLLDHRGDGGDCSPPSKDSWRVEVSGL